MCSTDSDRASPTGIHPTASRASKSLATGRETTAFCTGMGAAHTGSMDPGDYSRLQNSLPGAASNQADPSFHLLRSREEGTVGRDRKAVGEAGHKPSRSHRQLHKQYISSSEKGEPVEVDTQPESPKHVYNTRAFQDGRYTLSEGSPKQRRLHVQARFKRCIPVSANQCSTSEVPPIPMGGSNVSLQCSTVWASNCISGVHEASETCPSSSPSQRTEISSVFERHPNNWQEQSRGRESISPGQTAIGRSWICDQSGKITTKATQCIEFQALREKMLSIRQLAHIIGVLSSTHLAILPAPLHY